MPGSKVNAGDFRLSFAILVSEESASKVIHMFEHMGFQAYLHHISPRLLLAPTSMYITEPVYL